MTSFLQPIPIFGDFRTKYIGQQENIFLVSFSKWHFEYYTASANLFHSIQKKADISTADISKIWQLTWKRFRLKNNTKLDLGVNHVFKLVDLTSTVLIHNCCQLHLKNKGQVGELIRGQCHIFHCSLACASPYQSSFTEFRKVVFWCKQACRQAGGTENIFQSQLSPCRQSPSSEHRDSCHSKPKTRLQGVKQKHWKICISELRGRGNSNNNPADIWYICCLWHLKLLVMK